MVHYLIAAVVSGAFSQIYEHFSHGVYSPFMVGLFAWPLVLGALPALIFWILDLRGPDPLVRQLWGCSVLTLTLGSLVAGVMEIYGSTSAFTPVYWVLGLALGAAACVAALRDGRRRA